MVVPGSGLVKAQAEQEGLDKIFMDAGFEWRDAGCSMCLGMNPDFLLPGERCASTSNRNFEGRQGPGGRTHLVSPQMAAAAAIAGHFVDIRSVEAKLMEPFKKIRGKILPLPRADVDTDQIIPAKYLKRIERTGFGEFAFDAWRKDPRLRAQRPPLRRRAGAGRRARTSAAARRASTRRGRCSRWGLKAIIAPSFADIFRNNCAKIGLLTVELPQDEHRPPDRARRGLARLRDGRRPGDADGEPAATASRATSTSTRS